MKRELLTVLLSAALALAANALPKVGETLHGFELKRLTDLPDAGGRLWQMEHAKNGARLLWLERPDENRTFLIAFRTLPNDDTGVAHVMEHSVLCGSEKFPVKEPFVELLKSSMSTFLNAMTGSDYTAYPVASKNARDYLNLAEVYLDAVFRPLSVKDDWAMRQEGWHYELDGTNLVRNGVVFSEMKAGFGNPDSVGFHKLNALLYPDNTYGQCSGGDPAHIPELTFAKYRAFHRRFYHPSNAYVFLDGSVDLDATLRLLNSYLRAYDRRTDIESVTPQKPVAATATLRYESPSETRKTILWDGWVSGLAPDGERELALDVVLDALADSNEAPLKRALLKAGLCEDVEFSCSGCQQLTVYLKLQNTDPDRADDCRRLVRTTLERICREGLDHERLAALLDKQEFQRREIDNGQRGLHFFYVLRDAWMNGQDPVTPLKTTELFAKLRARLETGWFEQLLREAVLDNPHHATVTMLPSKTFAREQRGAERAELARVRAAMTPAELAATERAARDLKARQSAPDRAEDVAKLPQLSLKDIPAEGSLPDCAVSSEHGATILRPRVATGGIAYLDFCFSLADLSDEELLDIPFLAHVLGKLATERLGALALKNELDGRLGRFSVGANAHERGPVLVLHTSSLAVRSADALRLAREVALTTRFDDAPALADLRRQSKEKLERTARASGGSFANLAALRNLTPSGRVWELFRGMSQLRRLQADATPDLAALARKVFTRDRLTLTLAGDLPEAFAAQAVAVWPTTAEGRETSDERRKAKRRENSDAGRERPGAVSEGYEADGTVGYTTMAAMLPQGQRFSGAHLVAARIVSLEHLWQEIRVKGGAYGGSLTVDPNGTVDFSSWRDPNPARSLATFGDAGRALAQFVKAGNSIEKYRVSALAWTEPARSPRDEVRWLRCLYFDGRTADDLRRQRREILATSPADLTAFAQTLTTLSTNASTCVFAKRALLEPCKLTTIRQITPAD